MPHFHLNGTAHHVHLRSKLLVIYYKLTTKIDMVCGPVLMEVSHLKVSTDHFYHIQALCAACI